MNVRKFKGECAWLVAGLLAVFAVPYLFPHPDGHSESFMAHFSNRVGLLLILATAAGLGWTTNVFGLRYEVAAMPVGSRKPLAWVAALSVLIVALIWALERRLGAYGEALYFLDRYAQQALGGRLYTQFEFSYGPLAFWPQVLLARVTHLGFGDAHFAVLMLQWPAGLALIWYCARRLASTRRDCVVLFLLLSAAWAGDLVAGGVNYTPLRFVAAPALTLWIWDRSRDGRSPFEVLGYALCGYLGLVFFSPEQGIAFAFGTVLFFGILARPRGWGLPILGFACACTAGLVLAWRVGVLNTLLDIGGGTLDFPILPSARMIVLLLGVLLAGAMAVRALKARDTTRPELYLTAVCAALLPAALGRADPGHVFANLLPFLAISFCALARINAFRLATLALLGFATVSGSYHFASYVKTEVWQLHHREVSRVPEGAFAGRLLAPLGFPRAFNDGPDSPRPVVTGRFATYLPVLLSSHAPALKVEELAQSPKIPLVLPAGWANDCTIDEKERRDLLKGPLHPWFIPPARARDNSTQVLCDYVAQHYRPSALIAPAAGYLVLERQP